MLRLLGVAVTVLLSLASLTSSQAPPTCPTGSPVSIPTAWYSLPISSDPSSNASPSTPAYTYVANDPDTTQAAYHSGLIQLTGGTTPSFLNLSSSTGSPNSIGAALSGPIGGAGSGSLSTGTSGWTFEVTFKATAQATWAKLFDFGNAQVSGVCRDDILFGWSGSSLGWTVTYCDNTGTQYGISPNFTAVLNQWYHVVIVFQQLATPNGAASGLANYILYINGVSQVSWGSSGPALRSVYRQNSDMGKSDWSGDQFWAGYIDNFYIYDVALPYDAAAALYALRMGACSGAVTTGSLSSSYPPSPGQVTSTLPSPYYSLAPNTNPCASPPCNYGWLNSDPSDQSCGIYQSHQGLISLGGSNNPSSGGPYVNLTATSGPNSASATPFPVVGGASAGSLSTSTAGWTFEFMFKPTLIETWAKLMDIDNAQTINSAGGAVCHNDIIFGWVGNGPQMSFSTCDSNGNQYSINPIQSTADFTWIHAMLVIQQLPQGGAAYYGYINGVLTSNNAMQYYIEGVSRANADLGRSGWASDYYFDGLLDFFYVYNVAVSGPQALARWNLLSNSNSLATYCSVTNTVQTSIPTAAIAFQATFDNNPCSLSSCNYGWVNTDSNDTAADQLQHKGLLTLSGSSPGSTGQYVNLSAPSGSPLSIGQVLPELLIGDITPGTSIFNGTAGWAFEAVFKPTVFETWAKLFDIGNTQNPAGTCNQDIVFGWYSSVQNQMAFQICDQFGAAQGPTPAFTATLLNTWHHVIINLPMTLTGGAAYQIWLDGQLQTSSASFTNNLYPQKVLRTNANLGKSDWNDAYWGGDIDVFTIYQQALSPYQIAGRYYQTMRSAAGSVTVPCASPTTPTPTPWYSMPFTTDPRPSTGNASAANYGWTAVDTVDLADGDSLNHQGLLVLGGAAAGANGQYVNLSSTTGPLYGGSSLPKVIGGPGSGDATKGTAGWSFEVTFKATGQQTWAKLFDIGNPQVTTPGGEGVCRDDLLFGWVSNTLSWSFTHCDSNGFQYTILPQFTSVLNQWYHVVIVIQQLLGSNGQPSQVANYYMYINGQLARGSGSGGPYPAQVYRANADIGRSDWNDAYWQGELDTFNIYDYALTGPQVTTLYTASANVNCANGRTATPAQTATWISPAQVTSAPPTPTFAISGNSNPCPTTTCAYGYSATDANDASCSLTQYRQGLITLAGSQVSGTGPYINLSTATGPNSIGATLPIIGGQGAGSPSAGTAGWTFEYMVKPHVTETWAKLFDFGQPQTPDGACHYDIISGWFSTGPTWSFSTCDGNNQQYAINNALGSVLVDAWVHAVLVIQQHPTNSSIANYFSYVNGQLFSAASYAYMIEAVPRPNADIGRSNWQADYFWEGEIDFFNVYNVAISGPQALALYNAATNNGQVPQDCSLAPDTSTTVPASALYWQNTFDSDPRLTISGGAAAAGYGWAAQTVNDTTANQAQYKGVLTFSSSAAGTTGQYVNLSAPAGTRNSIGVAFDSNNIGGVGTGNALTGTAGWSFELQFKTTGLETWSKIFDFGNTQNPPGTCAMDILFGQYQSDLGSYTFQTCNKDGGTDGLVPVFTGVSNQWHHAVLVIQQSKDGRANFYGYLDGVLSGYKESEGEYVEKTARTNANLGKSDWNDAYWQGELDLMRVYSIAVNQAQVCNLYTAASGKSISCASSSNSNSGGGGGGSSLSGGAIAGIVIGSVVGALVLLFVVVLLCCAGARGKKSSNDEDRRNNGRFGEMESSKNVEMSGVAGGEAHHGEETA